MAGRAAAASGTVRSTPMTYEHPYMPDPVPATSLYGAIQDAVLALARVLPAARTFAWRQALGERIAEDYDPVTSVMGPCPAPLVVDGGGAVLPYARVIDLCVRAAVTAGLP